VDTKTNEIQFDLALEDGKSLNLIGSYGSVAQITGALGGMLLQLRQILHSKKGMASVAGEQVHSSHIQKDRWTDTVIVQLTTPSGIPYTFGIPTRVASEIADQLKTESAKPTQTGRA
jgi:hypothetical protein